MRGLSADVFIACSNSDEANIIACLMAKRVSDAQTICFVQKKESLEALNFVKDKYYKIRWNYLLTTFKTVVNDSLEIVRNTLAADQKFCEMYQRLGIDYIEKFKLRNI
jgi:Trk K+ transport system NAD-binding subunit